MRINKNIYSLNIYNNYQKSLKSNSTALERITSGLKLNAAKDNPIKIERSENLKMKIRSLEMANRNLQDGVSMIQTADGAMATIGETLIRMKELIVQSGNSAYSDGELEKIQVELDELKDHITKTAETTEFNGNKLIATNGAGNKEVQIGAEIGETMQIPLFDVSANTLGVDGIDVMNTNNLDNNISTIDKAISDVNRYRSQYGALQNRIESSMEITTASTDSLTNARSNITDADLAKEMIEYSKSDILIQSSVALMTQSNNFPKDVLNILSKIIK